ncbi:MAG TPA: hypothetical protein VJT32_09210 [bacterium]|nr:hypothetical protein [bacterium]
MRAELFRLATQVAIIIIGLISILVGGPEDFSTVLVSIRSIALLLVTMGVVLSAILDHEDRDKLLALERLRAIQDEAPPGGSGP